MFRPIIPSNKRLNRPLTNDPRLRRAGVPMVQAAYTGDLDDKQITRIINVFFTKAMVRVLKGYPFTFPFGTVTLKRIHHRRNRIDKYKAKNPHLFDNILQDKMYTDAFRWNRAMNKPYLQSYIFKGPYHAERAIPKYEQRRELNWATNATV